MDKDEKVGRAPARRVPPRRLSPRPVRAVARGSACNTRLPPSQRSPAHSVPPKAAPGSGAAALAASWPNAHAAYANPTAAVQSLIEKVTDNNESPAPGWALDQMARLTMQKPGIELEMVELLYKRLTKNSCDVKLKTLRAMHFISRRGSVAFRRAMQRGSQQIRVHLSKFRPQLLAPSRYHSLSTHDARRTGASSEWRAIFARSAGLPPLIRQAAFPALSARD